VKESKADSLDNHDQTTCIVVAAGSQTGDVVPMPLVVAAYFDWVRRWCLL